MKFFLIVSFLMTSAAVERPMYVFKSPSFDTQQECKEYVSVMYMKIYQKASELLSEYWSIGNSLDDLYSGYSARYPQIAQQWNDYLNADTGTKAQLSRSNPEINSLVKRRSDLRKLYVQRK